ncbi:hypothetical protein M758_10G086800 [Ceratodon purpureus]|nr:hypothetical protein M758_10G086800 [Ceratodon purpureus]
MEWALLNLGFLEMVAKFWVLLSTRGFVGGGGGGRWCSKFSSCQRCLPSLTEASIWLRELEAPSFNKPLVLSISRSLWAVSIRTCAFFV